MPPRCYIKRCAKKNTRLLPSSPRPCVDSLHLPLDFYLPYHMFYPPPYYHRSIIRHEYICECPDSSNESSHSSLDCMATNNISYINHDKKCRGACTPTDYVIKNERSHAQEGQHRANKNRRQAEVLYTPSINQYNERPPQYQNENQLPETSSSNDNHLKYPEQADDRQQVNFEKTGFISYPRATYEQMTKRQDRTGYKEQRTIEPYPGREAELAVKRKLEQSNTNTTKGSDPKEHNSQHPQTKNNDIQSITPNQSQNVTPHQIVPPEHSHHYFHGPPPEYTDSLDISPPHYSFPPSSCCKNSAHYTELRKLTSTEWTPRPQNMAQNRSPAQEVFDQSRDHRRSKDPIRRHPIDVTQKRGEQSSDFSLNAPLTENSQGHYMGSSKSPQHLPNRNTKEIDSRQSPCCANAFGRKNNDKPPLPKGMSGAHRPGFVFNEDTRDYGYTSSNKSACMSSSGSGCTHGISSIMPNINTPQSMTKEKVSSTGQACFCKDVTGKTVRPTYKNNYKKEAGTDECHSVTCLANRDRCCPCRYPPAFREFSCTGNISGTCQCNERQFE